MKHSATNAFKPTSERVQQNILRERYAADRQKLRQEALFETLLRAHAPRNFDGPPPSRTFQEGLIVVIATYDDGKPLLDPSARINTLHHLLLVLEHQRSAFPEKARENFKVIIADNGMTHEQRSRLKDYFISLSIQAKRHCRTKPECLIVDAPKEPGNDYSRTAGFARNAAFKEIRKRRKRGDLGFDAPVLIHDDDAVTEGIGDMYKLLSRNRNVMGAVAPGVRGVRDIGRYASKIQAQTFERRLGTVAQSSSFPPVFDKDGLINFSVLFAFGGSRIPKTCSMLLHPDAIDDLTSRRGNVFHVWKQGSFEDMCCSIGLACSNWDIFECKSSWAYDQVRNHPEARLRQQFCWAYDHATAFYDFSEISKKLPFPVVHPGISVLVPLPLEERTRQKGWGLQRMTQLKGFSKIQATIVRPEEVRETLRFILERLSTVKGAAAFAKKHAYAFEGCFETTRNLLATVTLTLAVVEQALLQIDTEKLRSVEIPFLDHKTLYGYSKARRSLAEALRFDRDTRVARLLGNLGSMFRNPQNDFVPGKIRYVALGPRQAT